VRAWLGLHCGKDALAQVAGALLVGTAGVVAVLGYAFADI
jgi:hypothetical protein